EEDAIEAADLGEAKCEVRRAFVIEEVRDVEQALALVLNGRFDGRMAVAERGDADAAQEIEKIVTFFVAQIDALSPYEEIGIALIGMEKQLVLRSLYGCQLHATITSVPSL